MNLQDKLINLHGDSIFAISIREGAKEDYQSCLKMIVDQASDNFALTEKIVGKNLLSEIITLNSKQVYETHLNP